MSHLFGSNLQPPYISLTVPQPSQWQTMALSSDKNLSCPTNSSPVQVNLGVPSTGKNMTYYTCVGNPTPAPGPSPGPDHNHH